MFELFFKYSPITFQRGELVFASGWPLWLLIVLAVAGVVLVGLSLHRNNEGLAPLRLGVIGALQALVVVIVLVLAWRPALVSETLRSQDNVVALLLDASGSMGYGDGERSRLQQAVGALQSRALPALDASFDMQLYAFSQDLVELPSLDQVPAPGPVTHIGEALLNVLREARSTALGAVVLVSDGADNSNRLDAARLAEIASFGVPIYTVGVGREEIPEDIELQNVLVAPQGLPGSRVSAQVSVRHGRGGVAQLKVYDGDAILASESIELPNRAGITTRWVDFDVGQPGVKDLRFTLDRLPGEPNVVNNTQFRPMEVPESRRTVLYIEGEPRWEYKFIRRAIDRQSPVRLASLLRTTPNKFYRQGVQSPDDLQNGFPDDEAELFRYDGLIIGSFEAAALTPQQLTMIRDFVSRRGGSLLMIAGRRGLADGGWGNTPVAEVLPARLPRIEAPSFSRTPAKASLTEAGMESLLTRLDSDREKNQTLWREMPDVGDFQYLDEVKPGAVVLLEAQVQGRTEPLLLHQRYGLGNAYVLASGGTWRWQMQLPHEDLRHETFWRQLLQAMATAAPAPVTLSTQRVSYDDEREVRLRAEVKNEKFEPAVNATVMLSASRGLGPPTTLEMTPVPGEAGVYETTFEADSPGVYRFEANAALGEAPLGSARVAVRRRDGIAEHFQIQQNRALLERLSSATGGQYFALDNIDALPEAIRFSPAGIVERELLDLWNMPINFLLLLLLKGGEWLLRLKWGRL